MSECDGWFDERGITFTIGNDDVAVRAVLSWDHFDPPYKKWLIMCWFDTTYGSWNGSRYDLKDSRVQMAKYLNSTKFPTYEKLIEASGAI